MLIHRGTDRPARLDHRLAYSLAFIAGATLATVVVEAGLRCGIVRIFALCILSEAMLLLVLAIVDMLYTARASCSCSCSG
ncbi:hypothetical protein [Paraburkholderia sp.]|uniref:hypothetical protein n=1 Tax=Paraburkholderia sp. TaxID=1926495 RepID=UPI0039E4CA6B